MEQEFAFIENWKTTLTKQFHIRMVQRLFFGKSSKISKSKLLSLCSHWTFIVFLKSLFLMIPWDHWMRNITTVISAFFSENIKYNEEEFGDK